MRQQLRIAALAICLLVGLAFLAPLPTLGDGPFHDDTNPPCLGSADPFCNGGDEGGGGGTGSFCYKCKSTIPQNGPPTLECAFGSLGDTCTMTYESNGDITCETEGSC